MGKFLRSAAGGAYRHKWLVIAGWIIILITLGMLAKHFYKQPSSAISIPGTSAQKALDRFGELFPSAGKGSGRVVFEAKNGETITQHKTGIEAAITKISKVEGVRQVTDPFAVTGSISSDNTVAYATVGLTEEAAAVSEKTITDISKVGDDAQSKNFAMYRGGDIISRVPSDILGPGEITGVVLALIVLLIMLGSLVAAGLPIIVAIVTIVSGAAGLFALSKTVNITSTTPVLAVMLGLAVGIDYSLFIVNKYRHYLLAGYDYEAATSRALATAGKAVLFAATTVVIALSALSVVGIPFMTSMGLAAAGTVAIAALVAVTLLPALFGVVGSRIFSRSIRRKIIAAQKRGPHESHRAARGVLWRKIAAILTNHPLMVVFIGVVVAGVIALPIRSLNLGLPTDEFAAGNTSQRHAYDALKHGFGVGFNAPLIVIAENIPTVTGTDRQAARDQLTAVYNQRISEATTTQTLTFQRQMAEAKTYAERLQVQKDIATAQAAGLQQKHQAQQQLEAQIEQYAVRYELAKIANNIARRSDVQSATPALVTADTTKGMIQVIPKSGPSDQATKKLIGDLRNNNTAASLAGTTTILGVTGSAALQMDINDKLAGVLPTYLG
ncbi:MAG TPA: MMPL family transporter, partial [Candidatus Saccharimonadales bacterium]|nr:MMPL family transporter [Candidatus Saccharimonadales bacterium]